MNLQIQLNFYMSKTIGITIAAVAYNEEQNIRKFLESIFAQKYKNLNVEKILITSDGSNDRTVDIVKSIKPASLTIIQRRERRGKSLRLNEIYTSLSSQVLVQFDADIVLAHPFVVENIVAPLINEDKVSMCGGNPIPKEGRNLIEKAINITCEAYNEFREKVRDGNNVFSADGRILAFRKEFIKKVKIPENMIANDMYTYFVCMTLGLNYRFTKEAIVYFNSPRTLADHIKQNTRFRASPIRMKRYFKKELVERELNIPKYLFLSMHIKYFLKNPALSFFIFLLNKYCGVKALINERSLKGTWDIAYTTKSFD